MISDASEASLSPYPRAPFFCALRWALRLWWLAFALYPANALFNLYSLVGNQGFGALRNPSTLAQALLLTQLLQVVSASPAAALPPLAAVAALILLGRWAHGDAKRERATLAKREAERERERELREARDAAVAAVPAAVAQHLDERKAAESAPPQPQGPPFDEHLLPIPDHLVGRGDDLAWVLDRLQPGATAAITALSGMGGIGKTTLAALAVHQARGEDRFPDGIAVVLCQDQTDPAAVLRGVLSRFDPFRREPEAGDLSGLAETAAHALKGKRALVVLDNVEPGLDIASVVAPLRAAGVAVLLTARQALPRSVVPVEASRTLDLLSPEQALHLFAASLGRGGGDTLNPAEHAATTRIVAALGRHTLAVKLAGAYAADLKRDLGALAAELEQDPLEVPEGETPRGVALVLARSTEALPPDARRLFAALAAFATPEFGRQAALALAQGLGYAAPETLLNLLVMRALMEVSTNDWLPQGSDRERLRLHPLLRAFGANLFARWTEAERETAERAVAAHYAAYANGVPQAALAADEGNITGALEWAHEHGEGALVAALCDGMRQFWYTRSRRPESLRYLPWAIAAEEANARVGAGATGAPDDRQRLVRLLASYGEVLDATGQMEEAATTLHKVLAVARELGYREGEGTALYSLGHIARMRGRLEEAASYLQQALVIFRTAQDRQSEAVLLASLGQVALRQGLLGEAEVYYQQALAIDQEIQDRREEGLALGGLGQVTQQRGRLEEAAGYYRQALVIFREVQDRQSEGADLFSLGEVAHHRGRLEEAEEYYRQALVIDREVQDRREEGLALGALASHALSRGRLEEAEEYYRQALVIDREVQNRLGVGVVLDGLGEVALRLGRLDDAENYYQQALAIHREVHDRRWEATTVAGLADIRVQRGEQQQAETYYRQALDLARHIQSGAETTRILLAFGAFLIEQRGQRDEGCGMLQEAIRLAAEMGLAEEREARETAEHLGCQPG